MAKPITSTKNTETSSNNPAVDFDWMSAGLPADVDITKIQEVGGLTPIWSPQEAWEEKFPPVIGWADRVEKLPPVQMGRDLFIPRLVRVHLTAPTKGVIGKRGARTVVELKAGDDILVPLTGNLENSRKLMAAVKDPRYVTIVGIKLTGQIPTGQPSEMWTFSVGLTAHRILREGTRYVLPIEIPDELPASQVAAGLPINSSGQAVNMVSGQARS